jgi:putative transposase
MQRKSYQSDVSDDEWEILRAFMPPEKSEGRPREYEWREILNGIFYMTRSGCHWRLLPHDLPPWWTVYFYFRVWRLQGIWEKINTELRKQTRELCEEKEPEPTAAVIDSQSVKNTETAGAGGFDGNKKINGIKRHIVVDTCGLLMKVINHTADIQDRSGAVKLLEETKKLFPQLKLVWADGGYTGELVEQAKKIFGFSVEIIKRSDDVKGFILLPRRWVVERTFSWLGRNRRLSKNYERDIQSGESFIYVAMIRLMTKRLSGEALC